MKKQVKHNLKICGLAVAICLAALICIFLALDLPIKIPQTSGVTFSRPYAQEFKLNPDDVLNATLDDLKIKRFRIPAYWSLLQPNKDSWDWTWLDRDLDAIAARQGKVVLAVGEKLPRWPECWIPDWAKSLSQAEREQAIQQYLTAVINRYKNHPAVISYQLENEPGFPFGTCPPVRQTFFDDELELIRQLDSTKPLMTTDSGELSFWSLGKKVDRLGISVYRVVIGPLGIFKYWFVPPQFYWRKAQIVGLIWGFKQVYISEFQMEPWTKRPTLLETPIDEQMQTFDLAQMRRNIRFAKFSGISTIDYWGVEWWYWMKTTQNRPEFWEMAKTLFQ